MWVAFRGCCLTGCPLPAHHVPVVVGLLLLPASLVEVFYNCNPKPPRNPHKCLLFLAPAGPFVLGNLGKPKFEMNSIHLWGFRGFRGALRGEELRRRSACRHSRRLTCGEPGAAARNAAPHRAHRYKHLWQKAGGLKTTPRKKKLIK